MALTRFSRLPTPVAFPGYILAPNGGRVFYLDSGGVRDGFNDDIASDLYTTLAAALNACRANRGDTIVVLPQHAENVTATSPTFVAGVRIVGVGNGDERPTFTWTVAGSQWAITVANVSIENCILNLAGTASTSTTKAIVSTAARTTIKDCQIIVGAAGGSQVATIGIELGAGADRAIIDSCDMYAPTDAACVSLIKIVSAIDRVRIIDNWIDVGMSATTNGFCTITAATTKLYMAYNSVRNSIASSTKAFVAFAGVTGNVEYNNFYLTNATGGATAVGTLGSLGFSQNFGCATNGSALLTPAAGS